MSNLPRVGIWPFRRDIAVGDICYIKSISYSHYPNMFTEKKEPPSCFTEKAKITEVNSEKGFFEVKGFHRVMTEMVESREPKGQDWGGYSHETKYAFRKGK